MRRWPAVLLLALTVLFLPGVLPPSAGAEPPRVGVAGERFARADGRSFFLLGANYVGGPDRSWTMWQVGLFDIGEVERDFLRAQAAGANTVRIFVRPPLHQELLDGHWHKLDAVLHLARRLDLYLIVTLADYREDEITRVAALGESIARRYADNPAVLAYNLKNEPQYQNLAITVYPGAPPPLQTDVLIQYYGERMNRDQAAAWRQAEGRSLVPARFSAAEAYIYANNYQLYREFLAEAGAWVAARDHEVSTLNYIDSPDGAKWQPLLEVLDRTLVAWLRPQIDALRRGDPRCLITVGYSNAVLARLSANQALDFISIHRFPNPGLKPVRGTLDLLDNLRGAFPGKPLVFEEFGYSNVGLDSARSSVHETALILHAMGSGLAGAAKWSLYDVADGWSERENNFGIYRTDGSPKPVAHALRALGGYARGASPPAGNLRLEGQDAGADLRYVYEGTDALFVAAPSYDDPAGRLGFQAEGMAQVFAFWSRDNRIEVLSTVSTTLRLNPAALVGTSSARDVVLRRADGGEVPFQRQGATVSFAAQAGEPYALAFTPLALDARIQIVWPHDNRPVSRAELANIGALLFERNTAVTLCAGPTPTVRLWRSLNDGVEEPVATGQQVVRQQGGLTYPAWEFNDVEVAAARDPRNKYYFRLSVDGYPHRSSVWSHGEDARTYFPAQDVPTGVAAQAPGEVDAKIQIVWPHDGLPVDKATKANIGVYLFRGGTLEAVPAGWSPTARLWRALNNGFEEQMAVGQKVLKREGGLEFPAWEFNDVDVSAARDPLNKYYFRVTVDGVSSRSNVWSHGADARTHFPRQDTPTGVGACD